MSAAWHLRSEISVGGGRPELCMARAEVEVCALHGARARQPGPCLHDLLPAAAAAAAAAGRFKMS